MPGGKAIYMQLSIKGCRGLMIEKNGRLEGGVNGCSGGEIHGLIDLREGQQEGQV